MNSSSVRLRAVPAADLRCVRWDDRYVVFHRRSGRTHFANESTWLLLDRVLREPREPHAAIEELAALQRLTLDDAAREHIMTLLRRLEEIGLLECA